MSGDTNLWFEGTVGDVFAVTGRGTVVRGTVVMMNLRRGKPRHGSIRIGAVSTAVIDVEERIRTHGRLYAEALPPYVAVMVEAVRPSFKRGDEIVQYVSATWQTAA